MSPKLPSLKPREVIKVLEKLGFVFVRQKKETNYIQEIFSLCLVCNEIFQFIYFYRSLS
jgi:hypothetical protein